jgi:endonuclease YncB( thermonuclease family)
MNKLALILGIISFTTVIGTKNLIAQSKMGQEDLRDGWVKLTGCKLVESESNDGDSFRVIHNKKEYVFRLYLVDAPETDINHLQRNLEQQNHFEAPIEKLIATGLLAKRLSEKTLAKPFTVITKFEDARGQTKLGRSYAFVESGEGKDLGKLLLEHGLARSYGRNADAPKIRSDLRSTYDRIEERAKRTKLGSWGPGEIKLPSQALLSSGDIAKALRETRAFGRENKDTLKSVNENVKRFGKGSFNNSEEEIPAEEHGMESINIPLFPSLSNDEMGSKKEYTN